MEPPPTIPSMSSASHHTLGTSKENSPGTIKKETSREREESSIQGVVASAIPRRLSSHFDPNQNSSPSKTKVPALSPEKMLQADKARDRSPSSGRRSIPRRLSNSSAQTRTPSPHTVIREQNPRSAGISPRYIDRIWDTLIKIDPNFQVSPRTLTHL